MSPKARIVIGAAGLAVGLLLMVTAALAPEVGRVLMVPVSIVTVALVVVEGALVRRHCHHSVLPKGRARG